MVRHKNKLYANFIKTRDAEILREFKVYRNKLTSKLKAAKNYYFINMFSENNMQRSDVVCKKLNSLLHPNASATIPDNFVHEGRELRGSSLATAFNRYFIQQGQVDSNDGISSFPGYNSSLHASTTEQSLFLTPTDCAEVFSCISSIKNSKSRDVNGFQIGPVKYVLDILCPVIAHIYNLILCSGVFPKDMQIGRVTPIFKHGDKNSLNNYRPISILPIFSKGIEKILHIRLLSYLNKHNLLHDFQHGFRKHRSTETALIKHKEVIIESFKNKTIIAGIYIDFSKAFDLINHNILLFKMYKYGIRGIPHALFESYLSHRKQFVNIDNATSAPEPISAGVPQGSILGPLLFVMYINDIVQGVKNAEMVSYADDTTVFVTGVSEIEVEGKVNDALVELKNWADANGLRINSNKTKVVLYLPRRKSLRDINICLGSEIIEIVDNVKALGVIFSKNLIWNDHIDYIQSKMSSAVGVMNRMRHILPPKIKLLLYNALVYSILQYCSLVWGTTGITNLKKLHVLQKRAIRCIANIPFRSSTSQLFLKYDILPVFALYNYQLLIRYKSFTNKNDNFIRCMSKLTEKISSTLPTRHVEKWFVPTPRTTYDTQSLTYILPVMLNRLHSENFDVTSHPNPHIRLHCQQLCSTV